MDKYILEKSTDNKNTYILIFSPNINSLNQELNSFLNNFKNTGENTIKLDLVVFVGNIKERFIQLKLKDGRLIHESIIKGIKDDESEILTMKKYSELKRGEINKIYPINYRNKIIRIKEESLKGSSF